MKAIEWLNRDDRCAYFKSLCLKLEKKSKLCNFFLSVELFENKEILSEKIQNM